MKQIFHIIFLGLLSWDVSSSHVDLSQELSNITQCAPPGEETKGGL